MPQYIPTHIKCRLYDKVQKLKNTINIYIQHQFDTKNIYLVTLHHLVIDGISYCTTRVAVIYQTLIILSGNLIRHVVYHTMILWHAIISTSMSWFLLTCSNYNNTTGLTNGELIFRAKCTFIQVFSSWHSRIRHISIFIFIHKEKYNSDEMVNWNM